MYWNLVLKKSKHTQAFVTKSCWSCSVVGLFVYQHFVNIQHICLVNLTDDVVKQYLNGKDSHYMYSLNSFSYHIVTRYFRYLCVKRLLYKCILFTGNVT
jgi:hypothetical protein